MVIVGREGERAERNVKMPVQYGSAERVSPAAANGNATDTLT